MDDKSACIVDFGAGGHHSHFRELCARALRRGGIDRIVLVASDCRADGADVDVREERSLGLTPGGGYGTLCENSRLAVHALETVVAAHPECGLLVLPYADLVSPSILLHRPKIPDSVQVVAIDMTVDGALPRSAFPAGWRNGLRHLYHRIALGRLRSLRWSLFLLGVRDCPKGALPLVDPADRGIVAHRRDAGKSKRTSDRPLNLLVYGMASPRKGIRALEEHLRFGADDLRIVFAGEWDASMEESRRFFESHPLTDVIARHLDAEESARLFEACDAVWLGYDHHYGSSGVLALAAAFGKPVLATPYGLIGMAAKSGCGAVFGESQTLAQAVEKLRNPEFYASCATQITEFGRDATDDAAIRKLAEEIEKIA